MALGVSYFFCSVDRLCDPALRSKEPYSYLLGPRKCSMLWLNLPVEMFCLIILGNFQWALLHCIVIRSLYSPVLFACSGFSFIIYIVNYILLYEDVYMLHCAVYMNTGPVSLQWGKLKDLLSSKLANKANNKNWQRYLVLSSHLDICFFIVRIQGLEVKCFEMHFKFRLNYLSNMS